jgi:predicted enzyme related to lactoylglutathione lyase
MVKDGKRAIASYRDVLGREPSRLIPTTAVPSAAGDVMPFQSSNGILFAVDDIGVAVEAVKARGAQVVMQRETPVCFMAMIADSEGNTVTLHQRKAR